MPSKRDMHALRNLISEAELILSTTELPQGRAPRCRELLNAAIALTDDFINQSSLSAAEVLGAKGGKVIAQRGSEYFKQLAAKRKIRGGGRPRKLSS